ncbi:lactate utilization protein C [Thalassobacillus sp. CUG 92003]|uniref:LutC/YkgG family protein n=1 Tax=Thalassobacillus sp. CUG 92003 TaxID=2736641 RepID=UPI0015E73EB7|nr:lactate utilization protein C [Thalassobacillus sp. CUG 92003]
MSIQNRESFLANLASNLGRDVHVTDVERPVWQHNPQSRVLADHSLEELVHVLEQQCGVIHTTFKRTSQEKLRYVLLETIQEYGGKQVLTQRDERFEQYGLASLHEHDDLDAMTWDPHAPEASKQFAEQADVGVTFSDITLAESGTVVLLNDEGNGRSISLLPRHYIAIIPKSTIVPRMTQAAQHLHHLQEGEQVPSCVSFITGPSNSADIEMNLIVGVHGPVAVTYLIVD